MNAATAAYFALNDNRPPPGVKAMTIRRHAYRYFGPYLIDMVTSCGSAKPHIAGSMRIELYDLDADDWEKPLAVRRQQVDSWREAVDAMVALEYTLKEE